MNKSRFQTDRKINDLIDFSSNIYWKNQIYYPNFDRCTSTNDLMLTNEYCFVGFFFQWFRFVQQSITWLFDLVSQLWEKENESRFSISSIVSNVSNEFDTKTIVRSDGIFRWTKSSTRFQRSIRISSILDQSIHGSTIWDHFVYQ